MNKQDDSQPVTYERRDQCAIITVNNPPVNALSAAVRAGLLEARAQAESDKVSAGLIICAGSTFIAGADITELDKPLIEPQLPDVLDAFEHSSVIWISVMHGTVLGGGFELALACDHRIADSATRFGLPEVNLGLIPGSGGTQRLPRLAGVELAATMATTGKMQGATNMRDSGVLASCFDLKKPQTEELITEGLRFIKTNQPKKNPASEMPIKSFDADFFTSQRKEIIKFAKGATAPALNLDAIEWAATTDIDLGTKRERELHLALRKSDEFHALKHVFLSERKVSKPQAINNSSARPIAKVGIVGGGLMGAGIAVSCLSAGLQVMLIETDEKTVSDAEKRIESLLEGALKRGKISQSDRDKQLTMLSVSSDYQSLEQTDLVIEAVFEDLEVKQNIFRQVSRVVRADTIIATNTSYLDPVEIAGSVDHPERIIGLHFFSPAHIMRLVEVVRTPSTSSEVLASAFKFVKVLRKTAVLCGICDGFIGNRMLSAYRRQADYLLADGASPAQVDQAMRAFGMPMGPYELQDLTGLQIAWANRQRQASTRSPTERYIPLGDKLCEAGRFGQKTAKGWYRYEGDRTPVPDEFVESLIVSWASEQGLTRQHFSDEDIQNRLLAALANEGARIVEEGIAERDLDVDIVKIHGYGFPRWRGGPMHLAKNSYSDNISKGIKLISEQSPESWVLADRYT